MKFTKISGGNTMDIKKKGKGTVVEGEYKDVKETKGSFGMQNIYTFEDQDGNTFSVYGFSALDYKMENVKIGQYVRITYDGQNPVKNQYGKNAHMVTVEIGEPEASAHPNNDVGMPF